MGKSILLVLFSFAGSLHQHAATAMWPCSMEVTMFKFNPWMQPPFPNRRRSPATRRLCGFKLLKPINFFCHQDVRLACGRDGDGLVERAGVPLCSLFHSLTSAACKGCKLRTCTLSTWQPQHKWAAQEPKVPQCTEAYSAWADCAGEKSGATPALPVK